MSGVFTACNTIFALLLDLILAYVGNNCLTEEIVHTETFAYYANCHLHGKLLVTRPEDIIFSSRLGLSSQVTILNQSLGKMFIASFFI